MGDIIAFDSYQKETSSIVASLILPIDDFDLLLPNVSVAEVIGYQQPTEIEGTSNWFLGTVPWRGLDLPVISYELINGKEPAGPGQNPRLIVINTVSESHDILPFFGFSTQTIPRQIKISEDSIRELPSTQQGPADKMMVETHGERAVIPNLDFIEQKILSELGK